MGRPTRNDIVYTAGLFDGEGCITIQVENPGGRRKSPTHRLEAKITNKDFRLLNWLKHTFGGYICPHHKFSTSSASPCWNWRIACKGAGKFLELVLPYLKSKTAQAQVAIAFSKLKRNHRTKLTDEQIAERVWYKQEISSLAWRNIDTSEEVQS